MKAKSIADYSLVALCNTFDLHQGINGLENQFRSSFLSGRLRQVLLYYSTKTRDFPKPIWDQMTAVSRTKNEHKLPQIVNNIPNSLALHLGENFMKIIPNIAKL